MQTLSRTPFTTVKTEGGILPADLLSCVAAGDMDGLRPVDYHLAPSERLYEAISRSWNRLLGVWRSFDDQRRALPESDRGTSLTAWDLLPFAQDVLPALGDHPYAARFHSLLPTPFRWDEDRRFLLRCELDAAYFHLYGIARDDVDYIMETFPIVKRKDVASHGDPWPHQAGDPRNLRRHAAGGGQRPALPDAARSAAG